MLHTYHLNRVGDDRYLLVDDVLPEACFQHDDGDMSEILTVICEGRRHSSRDFDDLAAYGRGGRA